MSADAEPRIVDNTVEQRYELWVGEARAGVIEYDTEPGVVVLIHTEVDPVFEGRGFRHQAHHWRDPGHPCSGPEALPDLPRRARLPSTPP